jgi:hypothetical protein
MDNIFSKISFKKLSTFTKLNNPRNQGQQAAFIKNQIGNILGFATGWLS